MMPGKTFFDCDRVEFVSFDEKTGHGMDNAWRPAKVFVSEITDDSRECRAAVISSQRIYQSRRVYRLAYRQGRAGAPAGGL